MYSYGSLFAQTVQEQNELFKRLRQKNSIDGRRTSIICLTRSGAPTPSLVLLGGSTLRIVPCDTGAEEPLSQESAYRLWQMHDASRRKDTMLFVCSDESDVAAHSVARGFLRAHWPAPTACKDNPTLNKSILQMMCDIRYLDQWGMWPPDETVKKAPLEPDGLRLILSGPGAWWRIFLMEKGREQGVFKYMIRTHTPDVVDISDSNTHCGTKHSVSEFGDSLHAIVVPQAPLRTCSSTSSLEDKYR